MTANLEADVVAALTAIRNPRAENDILSAGMIQDLRVAEGGVVSFTFLLTRDDPASLVREARRAVGRVPGVSDVQIQVTEPPVRGEPAGAVPVAAPRGGVPEPSPFPDLGNVIAVSSGKGGVGKSTVAANLACELAKRGKAVALMDADIYGPNIPRLFGVSERPQVRDGKIAPLEKFGVKLISLGLLVERDMPAIFRGPIITKIITQFLQDVDWGRLDYFIVDLPPGTGDAQLSLSQAIQMRGAVIVTTPQEMAVGDSLRGAKMFERVNVPVLGIVENMSYFVCPHCDGRSEIFVAGGGGRLADEVGVPLLGQIPLQAAMAADADEGRPVVIHSPESPAARALAGIADQVIERAGGKRVSLPIMG